MVNYAVVDFAACYSPVSRFRMVQMDQEGFDLGIEVVQAARFPHSLTMKGSRIRYDAVLNRSRSRSSAAVVKSCPGRRDAITEAESEVKSICKWRWRRHRC